MVALGTAGTSMRAQLDHLLAVQTGHFAMGFYSEEVA